MLFLLQRLYIYTAILLAFVLPLSTALTNIFVGVLLGFYILSGNYRQKLRIIFLHPVSLAAILFFSLFLVGSLYSEAPKADILKTLQKMSKLWVIPLLIPAFEKEKYRDYALWAFLSAVGIMVVASYLKIIVGFPSHFAGSGVFRDYIHTSLIVSLGTFILAHYIPIYKEYQKYLLPLLGMAVFYLFFINESRSGYLVFISLCVLWAMQKGGFKWLLKGTIMIGAVLMLLYSFSTHFSSRWEKAYQEAIRYSEGHAISSIGQRLEFYHHTWQLIKEKPLLGWGTGSFKSLYGKSVKTLKIQHTNNPHNEYLNVLMQLGIMGLSGLLLFFISIGWCSFKITCLERYIAQGVLLTMMVGCWINSWIMDFSSGHLFMLLLAISFGGYFLKERLEK